MENAGGLLTISRSPVILLYLTFSLSHARHTYPETYCSWIPRGFHIMIRGRNYVRRELEATYRAHNGTISLSLQPSLHDSYWRARFPPFRYVIKIYILPFFFFLFSRANFNLFTIRD